MVRTAHRSLARRAAVALIAAATLASASGPRDDIVLDVDLGRFELRALDRGVPGPLFRIAAGTPRTPTPRGRYELTRLIANPAFRPGPEATRRGASPRPPSSDGPLGVAKIPFDGAYQLHGGGHRYAAGMPVTLGCVQLTDEAMQRLAAWLEQRGALGSSSVRSGELVRPFVRRARLVIH
jgi:hypothetical protein